MKENRRPTDRPFREQRKNRRKSDETEEEKLLLKPIYRNAPSIISVMRGTNE